MKYCHGEGKRKRQKKYSKFCHRSFVFSTSDSKRIYGEERTGSMKIQYRKYMRVVV